MSGQQRIPAYLERHKVGALFEELMSKIIHEQPDDPIYFLIKVLQKKHKLIKEAEDGSKGPTPTRKSTSELFGHHKKTTPELSRKSMPASAASWAQSPSDGAVADDKQRGYEKPWLSHSKRLKPKKPKENTPGGDGENVKPVLKCNKVQLSPRSKVTQRSRTLSSEFEEFVRAPSGPRKQWNADNKVPTGDFDQLWEVTKGGKAYQHARAEQEREEEEAKRRESGWRNVMLGEGDDMVYSSSGYTGPYRKPMTEEEELAAELSVGRSIRNDPRDREETTEVDSVSSTSSKRKGPKFASEQHKKDLQNYIKKEKEDAQSQDSGYPAEDDEYDDAIEVLENPDDLKNEGVTGVKSTGVRLSKAMKTVEPEPQVRVSICARCARVIGGADASEPSRQSRYEELSEVGFERNGSAAVRFARQPPSDFADEEDDADDEEFESVSQVSGPRHPVWQAEDSDAETLTPRKGTHMFSPAGIPTKGRHMYGRDPSPPLSEASTARSSRRPPGGAPVMAATAPLAQLEQTTYRKDVRSPPPGNYGNRTWTAGERMGENESEEETYRPPTAESRDQRGHVWQLPDDSDGSTIAGWTRPRKSVPKKRDTHPAY